MTDLISRQAVLNELPHALWGKEWDEALAKAIIESMPTIDPVKHGKWEVKPTLKENVWLCRCSACGHKFSLNGSNRTIELAYCPWCGARMEEKK